MRFSANQLRMLQENLSPALPQLSAPPEMVSAPPAMASSAAAAPAAPRSVCLPCCLLGPSYVLVALALYASHACCSAAPAALGASPLALLVGLHALASQHSKCAQALGGCLALCLPAFSWASSRTDLHLLAASLAGSVFLALATPGVGLLKHVAAAVPLLVAAASLLVLTVEAPQLRRTGWGTLVAGLCTQATVATAKLRTFELVCTTRTA